MRPTRSFARQGRRATHNLVHTEDGADVDTRVDVTGTVQRVEDADTGISGAPHRSGPPLFGRLPATELALGQNHSLSTVRSADQDRVVYFLRYHDAALAGSSQRVDHDVV